MALRIFAFGFSHVAFISKFVVNFIWHCLLKLVVFVKKITNDVGFDLNVCCGVIGVEHWFWNIFFGCIQQGWFVILVGCLC